MYLRLAAILGVLTCATVACSIVDGGRVERVSPPAELTATLPPTTIATTTTEAATTTSGGATGAPCGIVVACRSPPSTIASIGGFDGGRRSWCSLESWSC